jgi:hypothetical protein
MPKIKSGTRLLQTLAASGTGKSKLDVVHSWFKLNRRGEIVEDIPADELVEMILEQPDDVIPPTTKEKAESFHHTGKFTPPPLRKAVDELDAYKTLSLAFTPEEDGDEDEDYDAEVPLPKKKPGRKPKAVAEPELV